MDEITSLTDWIFWTNNVRREIDMNHNIEDQDTRTTGNNPTAGTSMASTLSSGAPTSIAPTISAPADNPPESVESLIRAILESDRTVKEQKVLIAELRKLDAPWGDRWIYRIVIWMLGLSALGTVAGAFLVLIFPVITGKAVPTSAIQLPEGIIALGSAAIGALAGILVPGAAQGGKQRR